MSQRVNLMTIYMVDLNLCINHLVVFGNWPAEVFWAQPVEGDTDNQNHVHGESVHSVWGAMLIDGWVSSVTYLLTWDAFSRLGLNALEILMSLNVQLLKHCRLCNDERECDWSHSVHRPCTISLSPLKFIQISPLYTCHLSYYTYKLHLLLLCLTHKVPKTFSKCDVSSF